MMDDRFDDVLMEAAEDYNQPPETPRDLMWARIEATRLERARRRQQLRILYSPWTRWGIGIAAALVVGFGIGRLTLVDGPNDLGVSLTPAAVAPVPGASAAGAYEYAMTEHLTRSETFLTGFRVGVLSGELETEFWSDAGELLASTRLLLDSPAAEDPLFGELLEDLELVLIQIVQLSSERDGGAVDLVTEGLERKGLLPRLRTVIPVDPVEAGGIS
jgi:hypothetical protein